MKNILISYKDNPNLSLYTTFLGRKCHALDGKNWLGFDELGYEQTYTNSPGVKHILIQNCAIEEFMLAITDKEIKFRIVDGNELTKIKPMFGSLILKLDINVLSKPLFTLNPSHTLNSSLKI